MSLEELEKKVRALEGLEKKLQKYEDLEEIKKLHRNYVFWMCQKQWDKMLNCLTENIQADIMGNRFSGKTEIAGFFHNVLEKNIQLKDGHILTQPVINVEGTKASGYWVMYLFFSEPSMRWMQGRQECEYLKVDGQWKINSMKFTNPWPVQS